MMWWALLLACKRPVPPDMLTAEERAAEVGTVRQDFIGPARWSGPSDLCLDVPVGWLGSQGPAPRLLDVTHEASGATVSLSAWPWGTPVPQVPEGSELLFLDEDSYRTVPLLRPSATYTLSAGDGALTQGWFALLDGRVVVVEVQAPFGRTTEARAAAQPLLSGLARCPARVTRDGDGAAGR